MLQDEQAEEIVAQVRAEEKDSKSRSEQAITMRKRDTLAMEVKSPSKT